MKAAAARSKDISTRARNSTSAYASDLFSQLRSHIRSWSSVLIAELLCATTCEVA
jgi:hypothetical protein